MAETEADGLRTQSAESRGAGQQVSAVQLDSSAILAMQHASNRGETGPTSLSIVYNEDDYHIGRMGTSRGSRDSSTSTGNTQSWYSFCLQWC